MLSVSVNFWAVVVCGILAMGIGAMWYGPLFGKAWMKENGYTQEGLMKDFNPVKIYGLAFVAHILAAYVLARLMGYLNAYTFSGAFHTSFWSWLGFVFLPMFINYLFSKRTLKLLFIDTAYFLVFFFLSAIIISIWR